MVKVILMDIEGTTTSIAFVHDVLFPYSKAHLEHFIEQNITDKTVAACLEMVKQTHNKETNETIDDKNVVLILKKWIKQDRKHPALKTLQGLIWRKGYQQGEFKSHVYDDVLPKWQEWLSQGKRLAIYSSGSVAAQKLLFAHTIVGDLTAHLSSYFDTSIGPKKDTKSYMTIAEKLEVKPQEILFLSDLEQELNAAKQAGFKTMQLIRPGTKPSLVHPNVRTFSEIT